MSDKSKGELIKKKTTPAPTQKKLVIKKVKKVIPLGSSRSNFGIYNKP